MKNRWGLGALTALVLLLLTAAAFHAQGPQTAGAAAQNAAQSPQNQGQKAGEVFKNVQALKDATTDDFMDAMLAMSESMGASCDFCHVRNADGHFEMDKDDKRAKKTTREMIAVTQAANQVFGGPRGPVGCVTCHAGKMRPMSVPPIRPLGVLAAGQRPPGAPAQTGQPPQGTPGQPTQGQAAPGGARPQAPPVQPAAAEILDRYVQQLGGQALEKITARQAKGTLIPESGASVPFEAAQNGSSKFLLSIQSPAGASAQVLNGAEGWRTSSGESRPLRGIELDRLRRQAELFPALDIRQKYQRISMGPADKIDDREVAVIQASSQSGSERLYFDKATGLLVRRDVFHRTIVGMMPEETDFRDYRDVNGVKVPFEVVRTEAGARWTEKYTEVKNNAAVDDSKFEKARGA